MTLVAPPTADEKGRRSPSPETRRGVDKGADDGEQLTIDADKGADDGEQLTIDADNGSSGTDAEKADGAPAVLAPQGDVAPDGGYGWVCVFCVFMINAHTWGINSVCRPSATAQPYLTESVRANKQAAS
jgi:hypothetical protein